MSADKSTRYDFGLSAVDYVTESDFFDNVMVRFRQAVGGDEAQVTLTAADAGRLARDILKELGADPAVLIAAQLGGQRMSITDTRC